MTLRDSGRARLPASPRLSRLGRSLALPGSRKAIWWPVKILAQPEHSRETLPRSTDHPPRATKNHASPKSRPEVQTVTRSSPDAPPQLGHGPVGARQDPDHTGQGQGSPAVHRETDHPGQGRLEPGPFPALPVGSDQ